MPLTTIGTAAIDDNAITSAKIAAGTVVASDIAANSIDSSELIDGAVDLSHMSVNSIDSDQYVDGSIDLAHMSVNSIDSDQYVDGSIDAAHLATDSVTTAKIAANAVTNAEVATTVFTGQSAITEVDDADVILVYDNSASAYKKVTKGNFGGGIKYSEKTSAFTAAKGEGYLINTGSAVTATLPASPTIGAECRFIDATGGAASNNITIARNSEKIQGASANLTIATARAAIGLVYYNSTHGWVLTEN